MTLDRKPKNDVIGIKFSSWKKFFAVTWVFYNGIFFS